MLAAGNILFYIHTPIKVEGKGGVLYYTSQTPTFFFIPPIFQQSYSLHDSHNKQIIVGRIMNQNQTPCTSMASSFLTLFPLLNMNPKILTPAFEVSVCSEAQIFVQSIVSEVYMWLTRQNNPSKRSGVLNLPQLSIARHYKKCNCACQTSRDVVTLKWMTINKKCHQKKVILQQNHDSWFFMSYFSPRQKSICHPPKCQETFCAFVYKSSIL